MSVASFGTSCGCVDPTEKQLLNSILMSINTLVCKTKCCLVPVSDCAAVTVEGAWGNVGDVIQIIRWFDPAQIPATSFTTVYINTRTNLAITGLIVAPIVDGGNADPCINGGTL